MAPDGNDSGDHTSEREAHWRGKPPERPAGRPVQSGRASHGVDLAQVIRSLAGVLRQVPLADARGQLGLVVDPVELTLHVEVFQIGPGLEGIEWRVRGDAAHTLKVRLGSPAAMRGPGRDAVEEISDPARHVFGGGGAPGERAETEPGSGAATRPDDRIAEGVVSAGDWARWAKVSIYWLWDSAGRQLQSDTGRLLVRREVVDVRSLADLAEISSLSSEHRNADVSEQYWKAVRKATVDYAARGLEGELGVEWLVMSTGEDYTLSRVADVLNCSADWLRTLVERPLENAASLLGAESPLVPIGAGITAEFATARLTSVLEESAHILEMVGIVGGLVLGIHGLVAACAKTLARDVVRDALASGFERAFDFEPANREQAAYETHRATTAERDNLAAEAPGSSRAPTSALERSEDLQRYLGPLLGQDSAARQSEWEEPTDRRAVQAVDDLDEPGSGLSAY